MGRVANILERVRDKINDPDASRWSDANLIRIMNEGLNDIAIHARILRDSAYIPLISGQNVYKLPEDLVLLTRVTYRGVKLPLVTHDQMDNPPITGASLVNSDSYNRNSSVSSSKQRSSDWSEDVTEKDITAIVYDKLNRNTIQVYPRPIGTLTADDYDEPLYGLITTIVDDGQVLENSDTSLLTNIVDNDEDLVDPDIYGAAPLALHIRYYRLPEPVAISDVTIANPEIGPQWDKALNCYIAGNALKEDTKELNRAQGENELKYYFRELEEAKNLASENFVSPDGRNTSYDGMGR